MIIPVVRQEAQSLISKSFVRHASRKVKHRIPEKIPVQLLKDIPTLGFTGEIVKVRPEFMRSFLHVGNKACYITDTQGPRIPVVETTKELLQARKAALAQQAEKQRQKQQQSQPQQQENDESGAVASAEAMTLTDLSSLFNNMRSSRSRDESQQSAINIAADITEGTDTAVGDEGTYTSNDLKAVLPRTHTVTLGKDTPVPITREYLSQLVYEMAGVKVPVRHIKLNQKGGNYELLSIIDQAGSYNWTIHVPVDKSNYLTTLVVQKQD